MVLKQQLARRRGELVDARLPRVQLPERDDLPVVGDRRLKLRHVLARAVGDRQLDRGRRPRQVDDRIDPQHRLARTGELDLRAPVTPSELQRFGLGRPAGRRLEDGRWLPRQPQRRVQRALMLEPDLRCPAGRSEVARRVTRLVGAEQLHIARGQPRPVVHEPPINPPVRNGG